MAKKTRKASKPTIIRRSLIVERSEVSLGSPILASSTVFITLYGHLDDPLRGTLAADVQIGIVEDEGDDRGSVGAIVGMKQTVQFVIAVPAADFNRLWQMAIANRCRAISLSFDPPMRGKAIVRGWNASSELPRDD